MKKYTVEFKYYQYNSGCADNGTYTYSDSFDNLEDAREFKRKIDAAYESKSDNEASEWYAKLMEDVYFAGPLRSKAEIYEINIKKIT
jgi:hypothetical protein